MLACFLSLLLLIFSGSCGKPDLLSLMRIPRIGWFYSDAQGQTLRPEITVIDQADNYGTGNGSILSPALNCLGYTRRANDSKLLYSMLQPAHLIL